MPDHPGLDDDATIGGEQTAAAECGAASPERRAAAPRTTPLSGRRTWFDTRLPLGAQNLADEALAAVSIADAPHQDLEFVVVAAHGYTPVAGAGKSLEKSSFLPAVGIPQPPIPRIHRRDEEVSSFDFGADCWKRGHKHAVDMQWSAVGGTV
jgi:hypothetical protein